MRLFYISTLIFISFLLKSQQTTNQQTLNLDPRIDQLISQLNSLQRKITDLDTKGTSLQTSFNTANKHLEIIAIGIEAILKGIKSLKQANDNEKVPSSLLQPFKAHYSDLIKDYQTKNRALIKKLTEIKKKCTKNPQECERFRLDIKGDPFKDAISWVEKNIKFASGLSTALEARQEISNLLISEIRNSLMIRDKISDENEVIGKIDDLTRILGINL